MESTKNFFLILILHLTATTGQHLSSFIVREGDDVTLPCDNVKHGQDECSSTTWMFTDPIHRAAENLIDRGQINRESETTSDRLRVTENCSLVIKEVKVQDAGHYTCRQFGSGQQYKDFEVDLSVVHMTTEENEARIIFNCSVLGFEHCRHKAQWMLGDEQIVSDSCLASGSLTKSFLNKTSHLLKCKVTDQHSDKLFPFSPRTSGEKTGGSNWSHGTTPTSPPGSRPGWPWMYIFVPVASVMLLIIIIVVIFSWKKKTKGSRKQEEENTADPEDGVCYTSVTFTKKTKSRAKAQTRGDGDDDDGEGGGDVTYSTVNASSSSAGVSTDPSNLYAAINNPNKLDATS